MQAPISRCSTGSRDDPDEVAKVGYQLGAQAVIASLPMTVCDNGAQWRDYRKRTAEPLSDAVRAMLNDGVVSEALIIDHAHEGSPGGFDPRVLDTGLAERVPLIAFGGVS